MGLIITDYTFYTFVLLSIKYLLFDICAYFIFVWSFIINILDVRRNSELHDEIKDILYISI